MIFLKILYLGKNNGTSFQRAEALRRLGHEVRILDPYDFLPKQWFLNAWIYRTGGLFFENHISENILKSLVDDSFDLIWVDGGELISGQLIKELKSFSEKIINYNIDDAFGYWMNKQRWRLYWESLASYDLVVVMREINVKEAYEMGAKKVLRVYMSADEVTHSPKTIPSEDRNILSTDVVFVGTSYPERGPFLAELIQRGVPLTIYGGGYHKLKEWPIIKSHWAGPEQSSEEYSKILHCSKIALGLIVKRHRDLHTTRSLEIPSMGVLFCAERTSEHLQLYKEWEEAVFWKDAAECAEACKKLLSNDVLRKRIAKAGHERSLKNGYFNEKVCARILKELEF